VVGMEELSQRPKKARSGQPLYTNVTELQNKYNTLHYKTKTLMPTKITIYI